MNKIPWTDKTWNPVRGCSMAPGSEDGCPKCNARRLPRIAPGSKATAAACQDCGHVVERERKVEKAK